MRPFPGATAIGAGSRPLGYIDQTIGSSTRGGSSIPNDREPEFADVLRDRQKRPPRPDRRKREDGGGLPVAGPADEDDGVFAELQASLVDDGTRVHRRQGGACVDVSPTSERRTRQVHRGRSAAVFRQTLRRIVVDLDPRFAHPSFARLSAREIREHSVTVGERASGDARPGPAARDDPVALAGERRSMDGAGAIRAEGEVSGRRKES